MSSSGSGENLPKDLAGRPVRDLRISVTDRCNFRCPYCMPREVFGSEFQFLARKKLLTFEEILRVARVFMALGVEKIRLTGGEPLLRRDLVKLVGMLATLPGLDLALTTNGVLLPKMARHLVAAGLGRVTVSLDALDPAIFRHMGDTEIGPELVLGGIDAATEAGLRPVKINAVIKRGVNQSEIVPLARFFKESGHILRFIEYMDVGTTNGWRMEEVVPAREIVATICRELPIENIAVNALAEGFVELGHCLVNARVRLAAEG